MTINSESKDSSDDFSELKRREEQKRDAMLDPIERWKAFQRFLAWAESQPSGQRNTPKRCKELERAKLARWAASEPKND